MARPIVAARIMLDLTKVQWIEPYGEGELVERYWLIERDTGFRGSVLCEVLAPWLFPES